MGAKKFLRRIRRIKNPLKRIQRRYVGWDSSLAELFGHLDRVGCRYVVLRWFEPLPFVEKGEDVDILIDNADMQTLRDRLSTGFTERLLGKRLIKLDIHSVYPPPKKIAYYPPHLAERILENSILHPSGARVPCPEDHFFSLAFHALYRKGQASGIPLNRSNATETDNNNKYIKTLTALASQCNYNVRINLDDLDKFLDEYGWRPALDYIEKAQPKDSWREILINNAYSQLPHKPGLAAFVLRDVVLTQPEMPERVRSYLEGEGFSILAVRTLESDKRERIASELRGGDWGCGPYMRSGGQPAVLIVGLDVFPRKPGGKLARKQPDLENELVRNCKWAIRSWWNQTQPEHEKCNIIHSSDNCRQAFHYVLAAAPELADQILADADKLLDRVNLDGEILQRFPNRGRRSVVELVRQKDGQVVVRKKFRPGKEEYFQRETHALVELKFISPEAVPQILEIGDNYFTMPYYKAKITQKLKLPIPVQALRKSFVAANKFFDNGYVMLDFRPQNLIVSKRNDVKIIDYELVYYCADKEFFETYSFTDVVCGNIVLFPFCDGKSSGDGKKYYRAWGRYTFLSLNSLLNDPIYLLYLKRWTVGSFVFTRSLLTKATKLMRSPENGLVHLNSMNRTQPNSRPAFGKLRITEDCADARTDDRCGSDDRKPAHAEHIRTAAAHDSKR